MTKNAVQVILETSFGNILAEVYPDRAPLTAGAFLRCVDDDGYTGIAFARAVRPDNDHGTPAIAVLQAAERDQAKFRPGVPHESTAETGLRHVDGALSLARLTVGTATPSAFFISVGEQPSLDFGGGRNSDGQGFAVFGKVIEGMDIVRRIHGSPTQSDAPVPYLMGQMLEEPVVIRSARRTGCDTNGRAPLQSMSSAYWDYRVREFPFEATFAGDHRGRDQLERASLEDIERRASACGAFLARARQIDPKTLSREDAVTLSLMTEQLTNTIEAFRLKDHLMPKLFPLGFYDLFEKLAKVVPLNIRSDFEAFVTRLRAAPRYFEENIEVLEAGIQAGYRLPRVLLPRLFGALDAQVAEGGIAALIAARLRHPPSGMDEAKFADLRKSVLDAMAQYVLPALRGFRRFINERQEALCCDSVSLRDQPQGETIYRFRIRQQTTTELDPAAIYALGLEEVHAIHSEVGAILRTAAFGGNGRAFAAHLNASPEFVDASAERLLERGRAVAKRIDGLLPRLFGRLPRITYGVQSFTVGQSLNGPPALAQPAPADRSQAGVFWLTALPERCPHYQLVAYALHEAWPGHLMQFARAHELDHLPAFRRFGWADYNSYIEGWALYCERLGFDLDLYDDPYVAFGRLSLDMWRAVRLVVDTGIHWKGWSREVAIGYMMENSFLPDDVVAFEVDRYIGWPAQALSYKLGERTIRDLREHAERTLGERFSLRDLHDELLSTGPVSLSALNSHMREWISNQRAS